MNFILSYLIISKNKQIKKKLQEKIKTFQFRKSNFNNFNCMYDFQPISHQNNLHNQNQPYHAPQQNFSHPNNTTNQPSDLDYRNPEILGESQLRNINSQMNLLERDIQDNNNEIRLLNNKITKSDFQQAQLKRLFEKEQKLKQKRFEFEEILRMNEYLKEQILNKKQKENQIKHSLGKEYQDVVESKRRLQRQQRQRQKQQEAAMISYNQQALLYERQRKRHQMEENKRQVQQDIRQREHMRQQQKIQKQQQKQQYNQIINYRNQLATQKDHVYKQYYNHFMEEQDKLQAIYRNKAMEAELKKQKEREEQQKRQYQTFQMRIARENEEKLRKITEEKQSLRNFLQAQIQENNKRKARDKEEQFKYQTQFKSYQVNLSAYQSMEKERKRELQKRYDNELSTQIQFKNRQTHQNFQSPLRSLSLGHSEQLSSVPAERKTHNPVTNPIDFKIGITNPYLIRQLENTKQKFLGDNNLKLRNLAMIGNNSLIGGRR